MHQSLFGYMCCKNAWKKANGLVENASLWRWKQLYCELIHIAEKIVMIPTLTQTILIFVVLGTPLLLLIMFLPALIELRRPKDHGPRLIMDKVPVFHVQPHVVTSIVNIEEEIKFEHSLIPRLTKIIEVLPSLEV